MSRTIRIIGAIDEIAYKKFSDHLAQLEHSDKPVYIELRSDGGFAYDALAFKARIETSQCEVHICAVGYVASAAVLILACGDVRTMHKDSWVMVHEDSGKVRGSTSGLEVEISHMRRMEVQWCDMLAQLSVVSADTWAKLHRKTTYLSAEECEALGLVDSIV